MGMSELGDGTVGKALDVLDRVASFGRPVRFSELLDDAPYPKATLYRFVQTLTNQRMLAYDADTGTYTPGVRLVRLAHSAWSQSSLAPIARPELERLAADVGETVHLAQLDHAQVLYVDKITPSRPVHMFSDAGKVGPAYCTGIGKTILAFEHPDRVEELIAQQSFHPFTPATLPDANSLRAELAEIRAQGHGFDREEHEPGIICIAAPILSGQGRVLGAVSITSTTQRLSLAALEKLAPRLHEAADRIGAAVGSWRFPDIDQRTNCNRKDTI